MLKTLNPDAPDVAGHPGAEVLLRFMLLLHATLLDSPGEVIDTLEENYLAAAARAKLSPFP